MVTQVSLDRWPKLCQLAAAWGGPLSVAVYIPAPAGSAAAAQCEQLATQHAAAHIAAHPAQPLTLSLLYASHNAREGAAMVTLPGHRVTPDESLTYQQLYPINALRNLAIEAAGTPLVLFTEGDFLPSRGLCEELGTPGTQLQAAAQQVLQAAQAGQGIMLVLPTFELALEQPVPDTQAYPVPADRAALAAHPCARPFTCGVFSQAPGQQSLDYAAWWGAEQPLQAPYRPLWEPLGVVATGVAPRFDERFRGYGLNKQQWALHLAALGFRFWVLPRHFLVTLPHARAGSWKLRPGTSADSAQLDAVRRLYATFGEELRAQGLRVP